MKKIYKSEAKKSEEKRRCLFTKELRCLKKWKYVLAVEQSVSAHSAGQDSILMPMESRWVNTREVIQIGRWYTAECATLDWVNYNSVIGVRLIYMKQHIPTKWLKVGMKRYMKNGTPEDYEIKKPENATLWKIGLDLTLNSPLAVEGAIK